MLLMTRVHAALGSAVLWLARLFCSFRTTEICKELNLKPLHCVRGTAVNVFGEPLSGATVNLTPGNYELRVEEDGSRTFHFPIVW
jgi:hypothetical protein